MSQVRRPQHPNAALTPAHRLKMARRVVVDGWSVSAVARRFRVDDKTARKWCDRYRCEGATGMQDKSSRPRHSPNRTPEPQRRQVVDMRRRCRRGAGFIAHQLAMNPSTVHRICVAEGLGRLDRGDRSTGPPPNRCDTNAKPLVSWCTSTSRNSRRSPTAAAGAPTAAATPDPARRRAGATSTPPSTTAPASATQRSIPTRPAPPPPGSGDAPPRSTPSAGSPATGPHRQRPLLPLQRLPPSSQRHRHQPPTHPRLPAPDQRRSRAFPPHPQRRMCLRQRLDLRHPTQRGPPAVHGPLQSAPAPWRPQLGHPHGHPHPPKPGQRVGNARLAGALPNFLWGCEQLTI